MRVLVGHTNQMSEIRDDRPLPGRESCGDEILAFGNGYQQVHYQPGMSWPQLLAHCPAGWRPDVYIHWSPEYNAVPLGLEQAGCLTVGVYGDWNLGGQAIHNVAGMFDVLVADRNGGEVLRRAGYDNVLYARLWGQQPDLHYVLPADAGAQHDPKTGARDLDIVMLGSMNHTIQAARARWLARVARLSDRYRIVFAFGFHGTAYTEMLNRAKIVFNHSIRGEINMRAYEAPACGALLFNEADNAEIRDIYTDRVHCVLYTEDNLESLLHHYLAPENAPERQRVAQAGWARVQQHTYAHHFAALLDQLEPQVTRFRHNPEAIRTARAFGHLSTVERMLRLAADWLLCERQTYPALEKLLARALAEQQCTVTPHTEYTAQIAHLRAVQMAEWALAAPEPQQQAAALRTALGQAEEALALAPDSVLVRLNHATMQALAGQHRAAEAGLRRALTLIETADLRVEQLQGVYFPHRFGAFYVALERVWNNAPHGSEAWKESMRGLLAAQMHTLLSSYAYGRAEWTVAAEHAASAVASSPEDDEAELALARASRALGRADVAIASYRRALTRMPFLTEVWEELAALCIDVERPAEALELLEGWLAITTAFPMYADLRPRLQMLYQRAQQLGERAQALQQQAQGPVSGSPCRYPPAITRLLACPDWATDADWQPVVRAFASAYGPKDPVVLMLRADPARSPQPQALLRTLHDFLVYELRLTPQGVPNITLLDQALPACDHWKLVHIADALVATESPPTHWRQFAEATGKPIYTADEIKSMTTKR